MKYLFLLSFALIINMHPAYAQSKSLAAEVAATAMATLWKVPVGADTAKPTKWTYGQSIGLLGISRLWIQTANPAYFSYLQNSINYFISENGDIKFHKVQDYDIDNILFGRILLTLYNVTSQVKYYKAASLLRDQLKSQLHKNEGILYMREPFYAAYAKQFHEPEAFDDIANRFIWMEQHARDAKTGLYEMALVDVLENFPVTHPKHDTLVSILKRRANAIKKLQDPSTGLWHDILNSPKEKEPRIVVSASAMFVYANAKAVRLGFLPASYLAVSKKGYDGILKQFIDTNKEGYANLKGALSEDPNGVGVFIQAANEMEWHLVPKLGKNKVFLLDDYYNAEKKKDIKGVEYAYHYKWPEMYNNGFSFLGNIITTNGLQTKTLSQAPTAGNLKNASIYMIVDADNIADNPTPNYMNDRDAQEIYNWVKAGGVLVLFHNDKPNADFTAINKLSDLFGIHFNEDTYNKVIGINYLGGKIDVPAGHQILKNVQTIYQKEVCSITVKAPAKSVLTKGDLVVFATAKIGKGTVFATGDPWLYNEYTDGRMLPAMYQNAEAAKDVVKWLISQIPGKK
ncbi:MAG: glycoside hydrolase family 88 protein [Sediminibacterium sp.]|jgi:unsaturated rhamnogalacturonyl hydrolase